MPGLNWEKFLELPGDVRANFEAIARAATWRNFARHGRFEARAQQPGVEFHLTIEVPDCGLGEAGRHFGWQTKWWDLPSGRAMGAGRRRDVLDSIDKTTQHVAGITDWVLWTRHHLTPADQEWYYGLQTGMRMFLWTEEDLDGLLIGDAQLLRESFFGALVLTPERLEALHIAAAAEVGDRWLPEVHQQLPAETTLRRMLAEPDAWKTLSVAASDIARFSAAAIDQMASLEPALAEQVTAITDAGFDASRLLSDVVGHLQNRQPIPWLGSDTAESTPVLKVPPVLRRLRADQHPCAVPLTNLVAHVRDALLAVQDVRDHLGARVVAVTGDAGYGKTQLAATLAAPSSSRPAGLLLHGNRLGSRDTLDTLADQVIIAGRPVTGFEELLAATEAAAVRAGCRLPIVIDGLNEAEAATRWAPLLRRLCRTMEYYPSVVVVCTVRGAFFEAAIPREVEHVVELTGFDEAVGEAVRRYFGYYRIEPGDLDVPLDLVNHPLTLKILCEVTNPTRGKPVSADHLPASLTAMFDAYLKDVALRIAELKPHIAPHDITQALDAIGRELWTTSAREIAETRAKELFFDTPRLWQDTILAALENEGVLIRQPGDTSGTNVAVVYDMLAGHVVASSLVRAHGAGVAELLSDVAVEVFAGSWESQHPLASDVFRALVAVMPAAGAPQLWQVVPSELKTAALRQAIRLEPSLVDSATVGEVASNFDDLATATTPVFTELFAVRAVDQHPFNSRFLDRMLRDLSVAERDMMWTEWLRNAAHNGHRSAVAEIDRQARRWMSTSHRTTADALRARWIMWSLTSTNRGLRDAATEALYWYGRAAASDLFAIALDALTINDDYVGERALAAAYGVVTAETGRVTRETDPVPSPFNRVLEPFLSGLARTLIGEPDHPATSPTFHSLVRYYASGIFQCATRFAPEVVAESSTLTFASGPIIEPLRDGDALRDDARRSMDTDFRNYTIGRLFEDRENYDDTHPGHRNATDYVLGVVRALGWSWEKFGRVDRSIGGQSRDGDPGRVERYGKKYGWIGFYRVAGLLAEGGQASSWLEVDIDPTFPQPSPPAPVALASWARRTPREDRAWLDKGIIRVPDDVIMASSLDGDQGPWTLIHAEMTCKDPATGRRTFGLFNTVLVERVDADRFIGMMSSMAYPGRSVIDVPSDYYTFAGEIGWHARFAAPEPGRRVADQYEGVLRSGDSTISFESLTHQYAWESHHSIRNKANAWIPSKVFTTAAGLRPVPAGFDQVNPAGTLVARSFSAPQGFTGHMLYVRSDVLGHYAGDRVVVTVGWGERQTQLSGGRLPAPIQRIYSANRNVWRRVWTPAAHTADPSQEAFRHQLRE